MLALQEPTCQMQQSIAYLLYSQNRHCSPQKGSASSDCASQATRDAALQNAQQEQAPQKGEHMLASEGLCLITFSFLSPCSLLGALQFY